MGSSYQTRNHVASSKLAEYTWSDTSVKGSSRIVVAIVSMHMALHIAFMLWCYLEVQGISTLLRVLLIYKPSTIWLPLPGCFRTGLQVQICRQSEVLLGPQ